LKEDNAGRDAQRDALRQLSCDLRIGAQGVPGRPFGKDTRLRDDIRPSFVAFGGAFNGRSGSLELLSVPSSRLALLPRLDQLPHAGLAFESIAIVACVDGREIDEVIERVDVQRGFVAKVGEVA
jgi:hypothetical protein